MTTKTSILNSDIGVIDVKGNLMGGDETAEFRQELMKLLDQRYRKLVLDFKGVTFMNSTALGVLIAAHMSSTRKGCQIVLCNLNNSVHSLLMITKLNLILNVRSTREDAVMSLV